MTVNKLEQKSKEIRRKVLDTVYRSKHGHLGGSFSGVDILVALYYGLQISEKFILSKGHSCLPLYAILEDKGILPAGSLNRFCQDGGLPGHPDLTVPGIVAETGSLGHGLGIAAGMALAGQSVIALIGDGELYEGSTWEAISFIAHHKLDVILIIDRNRQVVCDFTEDINALGDVKEKLKAFKWWTCEIDGHDFDEIQSPFIFLSSKPLAIIANTVKGKGVSFMEHSLKWHHSIPTQEEYELGRKELS